MFMKNTKPEKWFLPAPLRSWSDQ